MALHLAGLAPRWDEGTERVSGFEILPLALLDRPRIDVTLRVSGLFRDVFPGLAGLFEQACAALANRADEAEFNPYTMETPRVFAPKAGHYGVGLGALGETFTEEARKAAGEAWLAASGFALTASGESLPARAALEARVAAADAFVHTQDLLETDLLLAADYAAHEAGFAAAKATLGGRAKLFHLDSTNPATPRARLLNEEIARVVRARAASPRWLSGMMCHGFRGAAEIAATLDHLAAFAQLTREVPPHLFDLYYEATLDDTEVAAFLARENPGAFDAMQRQFAALLVAGLWVTRRNSVAALGGT